MSFRSALRPLKRLGDRGFEELWRCAFALAGQVRRTRPADEVTPRGKTAPAAQTDAPPHVARLRPALWHSAGGLKVLVVAPHPDDEAIGCAGTILRHVEAGDGVWICIATDGRRSRVLPDPDRMAEQRQREAVAAARHMAVTGLTWLGLPEGQCRPADLARAMLGVLRDVQPDLIYAPSRIDFHPEHFKVAHALALALRDWGGGTGATADATVDAAVSAAVRMYTVQVPLGATCNLVSELPGPMSRVEEVFSAYSSQSGVFAGVRRRRRYSASLHRLAAPVEEFWQVAARDYIALHREEPRVWPPAFRGLRNLAVLDPLAYLVGRAERGRLKALVSP